MSASFVQDNFSWNKQAGTLRGLHFQRSPKAQAKLLAVLRGRILDVVVDLRRCSPWYGKSVSVELSADNGVQIFIPEGFAHGFVTLEPDTEIFYKVSEFYSPELEAGVRWDDPDLAIDWRLVRDPILSKKDLALPSFRCLVRGGGDF